eukprot:jgi/Chlat1/5971/Chrsp4S06290
MQAARFRTSLEDGMRESIAHTSAVETSVDSFKNPAAYGANQRMRSSWKCQEFEQQLSSKYIRLTSRDILIELNIVTLIRLRVSLDSVRFMMSVKQASKDNQALLSLQEEKDCKAFASSPLKRLLIRKRVHGFPSCYNRSAWLYRELPSCQCGQRKLLARWHKLSFS